MQKNDFLSPTRFSDGISASQTVMRTFAKSFYWANRMLPKTKRNAIYAVYAFCRISDNLADQNPPKIARKKLLKWKKQLKTAFKKKESQDPILHAFVQTVRTQCIPKRHAFCLLDGLLLDVSKNQYANFAELKTYCKNVAGTPGLMLLPILGYSNPKAKQHAVQLGMAMQLTNILRDVTEDYQRGKVYLPQSIMKRFDCTTKDLKDPSSTRLKKTLQKIAERAEKYYQKSHTGINMLKPDARFGILLSFFFYRQILLEIRKKNFAVLTRRVVVPAWKKTILFFQSLIHHRVFPRLTWDST